MSEIRQTTSPKAREIASVQSTPSANPWAQTPVQARRDFDAAIRRVRDRESDEPEEAETSEHTPADAGLPLPSLIPYFPPLVGHSGQTLGGDLAGLGGHTAVAQPALPTSPLPDAIPTALQTNAMGVGQPLRMQVPLGGAEAATLALRLAQTGAGQGQLRVGGDASTRLQLAPHLERLRDRLRERSTGGLEDIGFDDDTES
jgi:hypothetical protein